MNIILQIFELHLVQIKNLFICLLFEYDRQFEEVFISNYIILYITRNKFNLVNFNKVNIFK